MRFQLYKNYFPFPLLLQKVSNISNLANILSPWQKVSNPSHRNDHIDQWTITTDPWKILHFSTSTLYLLQSLLKENSKYLLQYKVSWRRGGIPNIRLGHAKICLRVALVGKFGQFVPISSFSDLPPVNFPSWQHLLLKSSVTWKRQRRRGVTGRIDSSATFLFNHSESQLLLIEPLVFLASKTINPLDN